MHRGNTRKLAVATVILRAFRVDPDGIRVVGVSEQIRESQEMDKKLAAYSSTSASC
jgi:hypothetical protein